MNRRSDCSSSSALVLVFVAIEVTVGTGLFTSGYHLYVNYRSVEGLRDRRRRCRWPG